MKKKSIVYLLTYLFAFFIFLFWLCWVFFAAWGLFAVVCKISPVAAQARGVSCCGARALEYVGSVVSACKLSCPMACGILIPPLEIELASPALEGGFLTTGPPGKSLLYFF